MTPSSRLLRDGDAFVHRRRPDAHAAVQAAPRRQRKGAFYGSTPRDRHTLQNTVIKAGNKAASIMRTFDDHHKVVAPYTANMSELVRAIEDTSKQVAAAVTAGAIGDAMYCGIRCPAP